MNRTLRSIIGLGFLAPVLTGKCFGGIPASAGIGVFAWGNDYQITSDPKLVEGARLVYALGVKNIALTITHSGNTALAEVIFES